MSRQLLGALPSVGGEGNVAVSGEGTVANPYVVTFKGALGGSDQPTLTADTSELNRLGRNLDDRQRQLDAPTTPAPALRSARSPGSARLAPPRVKTALSIAPSRLL